ncbi:MAG: hypothetical protein AAF090_18285 [Bacteroidota bacterium]
MATDCLQIQLHSFLKDAEQKRMVMHFPNLQIKTFQHGACLQNVLLADRRLRFVKTKAPTMLRIHVLDNLAFRFSFVFSVDVLYEGNKICAQKLPRPLDKGWICIHNNKVQLGFWIDGPDPNLRVYVEQQYLN